MTENVEGEPVLEAQAALALSARAGVVGEEAGRRYGRRYLLGIGVVYAAWLVVIAVASLWLDGVNSPWRGLAVGASVGLLFAVALRPAQAEPVRARVGGHHRFAMVAGGAVVFAIPAAIAADRPGVALVGVPFVFGYWAAWAWWSTRD